MQGFSPRVPNSVGAKPASYGQAYIRSIDQASLNQPANTHRMPFASLTLLLLLLVLSAVQAVHSSTTVNTHSFYNCETLSSAYYGPKFGLCQQSLANFGLFDIISLDAGCQGKCL